MAGTVLLSEEAREQAGKKATRAAYGETLVELVQEGVDVYAVDADLSGSTTTAKLGAFAPGRLVNVGIAEQNMIDVAAGLSLADKVVFTGSFAVFGTGRAYDQIRNTVCYANLNVKIAPTHAGISVGPDGGSHQMVEDIALMRVLPGMRVLVPADYTAAKAAIRLAAAMPGPFYIRMSRAALPVIYDAQSSFALGSAHVLKEGSDVTIIACGLEVAQALEAAELLEKEGISAEVIDAFSIKPLDEQAILASVQKTGHAVSVEEHSIIGGLGCAVAELLCEKYPAPLVRLGVKDRFGTSGQLDELLEEYNLNTRAIVEAVRNISS